ncbi:Ig-like domain-containing protein [Metabacillus sp. 113a]|uniref:Ig-like domain-containing protein n=1 Tax=Metabacillus sp. 113a TaxID=3404706 RepID=UPI003CE73F54
MGTAPFVPDTMAPELTLKSISKNDRQVKGRTEAGAAVYIFTGTKTYKAQVNKRGKFAAEIPPQKTGRIIIATAIDESGNKTVKSIKVSEYK